MKEVLQEAVKFINFSIYSEITFLLNFLNDEMESRHKALCHPLNGV